MDNHKTYTRYEAIEKPPSNQLRSNRFSYEHFPIVCPTCEGNGEIEEDLCGMVTFVSVKDKRLRPAWTKVKITVLLFVILTIVGCATYFLYPYGVHILMTDCRIVTFNFNGKVPWIIYMFQLSIDNSNFFPVKVKDMKIKMWYYHWLIGIHHPNNVSVGIKEMKKLTVTMNVSYEGDASKYFLKECFEEKYYVAQVFRSSAELSYWMHDELIESKFDYFYTDCSAMVIPWPTVLPSTAGTTIHTPMAITNATIISSSTTPNTSIYNLTSAIITTAHSTTTDTTGNSSMTII